MRRTITFLALAVAGCSSSSGGVAGHDGGPFVVNPMPSAGKDASTGGHVDAAPPPTCGAAGETCCTRNTCGAANLTCIGGTCTQMRVGSTGEPCMKNRDCPSGICLPVGNGSNVCTATCSDASHCVAGWSCGALVGQQSDVCLCSYASETCDGKDNDCDGIVDNEPVVDEACATGSLGAGAVCQNAGCTCGGGTTKCGAQCTDTNSDTDNCGSCGNVCPGVSGGSATCNGGVCAMGCAVAGQTACGGTCTDTNSDVNNCGACDNACGGIDGGTLRCSGGSCTLAGCVAGDTACQGACIDTQSDPNNCGGCGMACDSDQSCGNGACCGTIGAACSGSSCCFAFLCMSSTCCGDIGAVCGSDSDCCAGNCVTESFPDGSSYSSCGSFG